MRLALNFRTEYPDIEVICTNQELPTMKHQSFWISYLARTGASAHGWIYWLSYDDEVRLRGIDAITDAEGNWPLTDRTAYFGPWAMRHEQADDLWAEDSAEVLESWTSFPKDGPTRLPVMKWISEQIIQPTYMQMSASVCPLANFIELGKSKPAKPGPMRIEMAVAAGRRTTHVEEFSEPISIIYGRPNSDRASYGRHARREDLHLLAWLARYAAVHPGSMPELGRLLAVASAHQVRFRARGNPLPSEEWRVRGSCPP